MKTLLPITNGNNHPQSNYEVRVITDKLTSTTLNLILNYLNP